MEVELDFDTVRERWLAAGGKDTGGVIAWFAQAVDRWVECEVPAREVAHLRFIGGDDGGQWAAVTGGSNCVGDLQGVEASPGFRWDPNWALITVRDPESGARVLLDGNERASQLQLALASGRASHDETVRLITGDLHVLVVRIGKAVSSLWR